MEFYIKQNSTLPILKMEIIKDGRSDFNLNSFLSGSSTFLISIYDKSNDKFLFASKECFVTSEYSDFEGKELYYLNYQFTNKDTLKTGRYEVQVSILSDQGVILLPLQEKYYVNVLESFSVDNLGYGTLYSANLPCCGFQETFDVDGITLDAYYYSGSLIIDYVLTSTKIYNQDITVDFTNVLEVFTGEPIEITTGVTISSGQTRGITQIIFEGYDYDNLTQRSYLKNVIINENVQDTVFNLDETLIFNTPAPTAAPTNTPTGTAIPTSTPTPTITPTPSVTPAFSLHLVGQNKFMTSNDACGDQLTFLNYYTYLNEANTTPVIGVKIYTTGFGGVLYNPYNGNNMYTKFVFGGNNYAVQVDTVGTITDFASCL